LISKQLAGTCQPVTQVRTSPIGTSWSSSTATTVVGIVMRSGSIRCRSIDSERHENASGE
jgi:hypothetical protein